VQTNTHEKKEDSKIVVMSTSANQEAMEKAFNQASNNLMWLMLTR